jgi:hypothetical protein
MENHEDGCRQQNEKAERKAYVHGFLERLGLSYQMMKAYPVNSDYQSFIVGWRDADDKFLKESIVELEGDILSTYIEHFAGEYELEEFQFIVDNIPDVKEMGVIKIHGKDTIGHSIVSKIESSLSFKPVPMKPVKSIISFHLYPYVMDSIPHAELEGIVKSFMKNNVNIEYLLFDCGKLKKLITVFSEKWN